MVKFLKIETDGTMIESDYTDLDNLYKKCGFRKADGFEKMIKEGEIEVWGRSKGKGSHRNLFIFPFSAQNGEIFGNCAIIRKMKEEPVDLTEKFWESLSNLNQVSKEGKSNFPSNNCEKDENESDGSLESFEIEELSDNDSELKEEDYIFSSEEEN